MAGATGATTAPVTIAATAIQSEHFDNMVFIGNRERRIPKERAIWSKNVLHQCDICMSASWKTSYLFGEPQSALVFSKLPYNILAAVICQYGCMQIRTYGALAYSGREEIMRFQSTKRFQGESEWCANCNFSSS